MSKQLHRNVSEAVYAALGWKSHESNRIIRQAHNMDAAASDHDILTFILTQFAALDEQIKDIYASWRDIEGFVEKKDEEGYITWAVQREMERQMRLGSKQPRVTPEFVANRREQFKRWLLET